MNERGEIISLSALLILVLSTFLVLCSLELRREFKELQSRAALFLCAKEFKGELETFLFHIGRTNWTIKNLDRISKISFFIPGLQGASFKSAKAKKIISLYQNSLLISYLKKLGDLKQRSCPIGIEFFKTPYHINLNGFVRDNLGGALLRNSHLSYSLSLGGSTLKLKSDLSHLEALSPRIQFESSEKREKQFFLWPSL